MTVFSLFNKWGISSVGQSSRLITGLSKVRTLDVPPSILGFLVWLSYRMKTKHDMPQWRNRKTLGT